MSSFKSVSWVDDEDLLTDKLNQMASNEDYLNDHLPDVTYNSYGIVRTDGIKILSGVASLGPGKGSQLSRGIYFGNFFTVGCKPVVTATHASSTSANFRCFITIKGIPGGVITPDHTGFAVILNNAPAVATTNNFPTVQHVHWTAIGY